MKPDLTRTDVGGFNYEFLRTISLEFAGAAMLGECLAIAARIRPGDFESWTQAWTDLADRVSAEAEAAVAAAEPEVASSAFRRASNYYRSAVFFVSADNRRHQTLWARSKECFVRAAGLPGSGVEPVSIPYEDGSLPGYLMSAKDAARGTLLAIGGFDSTAEEVCSWIGLAAPRRGWNCLVFEGPGQWGALQTNPGLVLRPDYEVPVGAALDYLASRREIRRGQLTALIGYSLGGLLAPRAAAFEPRIGAVIADSLLVDVGEAFRAAWPPILRAWPPAVFNAAFRLLGAISESARWAYQHARWNMGIEHPHEFFEAWSPYTLRGLEEVLACPLLCLLGEDEVAQTTRAMAEATANFLDRAKAPWSVRYFPRESGAASHCQMGAIPLAQAAIFGWLDEVAVKHIPSEARQVPERLTRDTERYHGFRRDLAGSTFPPPRNPLPHEVSMTLLDVRRLAALDMHGHGGLRRRDIG